MTDLTAWKNRSPLAGVLGSGCKVRKRKKERRKEKEREKERKRERERECEREIESEHNGIFYRFGLD